MFMLGHASAIVAGGLQTPTSRRENLAFDFSVY
jgi:hypothetical protein